MQTMRAVVYDGPGSFAVRRVPEPGPGEMLLRVLGRISVDFLQ